MTVKKQLIIIVVTLILSITVVFLLFTSHSVIITEKDKYGQYDEFVNSVLKDNHEELLPEINSINVIDCYAYEYKTSVVDNGVFSIYLKTSYDRIVFDKEIMRLKNISIRTNTINDEVQYYWAASEPQLVRELYDDEIRDGLSYFIACARADNKDSSIEYYVAYQIEGQEFIETTNAFILTCLRECT